MKACDIVFDVSRYKQTSHHPKFQGSTHMTSDQTIKLDQFLKLKGIASTGGQAKILIQSGDVDVNNAMELRRGRKLREGDTVTVLGTTFLVEMD